jgi:glycosyltransferase involved in cell wall biosynthesis
VRPLLLNTFDHRGGAGIATYRLHEGLRGLGVDSRMLVQYKSTADTNVLGPASAWQRACAALRPTLDRLEIYRYGKRRRGLFFPAWLPDDVASRVDALDPDIVHLFWLGGGFLRIETLSALRRPIVWTLHDMWPFTGGCHYDDECGRFREACGNCPMLQSDREADLSRRVWQRKHDSWRDVPMVVVATSNWIAERARASSLFRDRRIEVIPNGIDTGRYAPQDKAGARAALGLPQDKRLILFSAVNATSDRRKGAALLFEALRRLADDGLAINTELVVLGASGPEGMPELGMNAHYMGYRHDAESQIALYSAADVVVAPSMQENLSNVVMESLACGAPVVAFRIGGMPDLIDHHVSGYLAAPFEAGDLAAGLKWVLADHGRHERLVQGARRSVLARFSIGSVASRYLALYEGIRP